MTEVAGEVPGLLSCPYLSGVGGDAGDVQASGAVFEERQGVQTVPEHGVDVEEVRRKDALGLSGEELAPVRAVTAWHRVNARVMQDLPDRRGSDAVAEPGQFALDPSNDPTAGSPWRAAARAT